MDEIDPCDVVQLRPINQSINHSINQSINLFIVLHFWTLLISHALRVVHPCPCLLVAMTYRGLYAGACSRTLHVIHPCHSQLVAMTNCGLFAGACSHTAYISCCSSF